MSKSSPTASNADVASSFDPVRPRVAPDVIEAITLDGVPVLVSLDSRTLVVAVKADCFGCRDMVQSPLDELGDLRCVFLTRELIADPDWVGAPHQVLVSPAGLDALAIGAAPFYVLVDPPNGVVAEGVVFGPSQVRSEIATYLV